MLGFFVQAASAAVVQPALTKAINFLFFLSQAEGHKIDYDDWHKHVHYGVLDYAGMLKPDPELREILCSIDIPKYILTNADRKHAQICLDQLGISDCFLGMFDFERINDMAVVHGLVSDSAPGVLCKPQPKTYQLVLEELGVQASDAIFFDDSIRNCQGAHQLGIYTVLVGREDVPAGSCDAALIDMHALPRTMPELVDQPGLVHEDPASAHSLPHEIDVVA